MFTQLWKQVKCAFNILFVIVFMLAVTPLQAAHAAGVLYAKPAASGTGDCLSWTNACTLQTALNGATSGDEIWVAAGTYKPTTGTDRAATFQLKNGVALYGGFAGTETARDQRHPVTNVTTLSGDLNGDDVGFTNNFENVYHVVAGADNSTLDGFTVTGGNANDQTGGCPGTRCGGGMSNFFSNPTVTNVTFSGNSADYGGGGMFNNYSNPTVTNVTFKGNSVDWYGGGMFNGYSNPTLTNVTFSGNLAPNEYSVAGGMLNYASSPILVNVTFSSNSAGGAAGGMFNFLVSSPTIYNTIFWGNTAPLGAQIYNDPGTGEGPSTAEVSYSVVEGGYADGSHIIEADPMLGTLGDYGGFTQTIPLLPGSSAINAGNDATCATTDQRGITRPQGEHCDIGSFEADYPTVFSIVRADPNPTTAASVNFTVTFSESVTGLDTSDFTLTTTGLTGASVTSVSGSGATYSVTVSNGTGTGTIRLDVIDDDSIQDDSGNPLGSVGLGNGNFTIGETYTINNPVPTTTSLSPSSATAGGVTFTLTVNGTNFVNGSTVRWDGSDRTTTYVGSTQLTASIPAADIATAGTASVTVFNGTPGGGTSNAQTFTINNPVPTTTSLSPSSAPAGGVTFTLTVNGTNFVNGSTVRWNGSDRTTNFVDSMQLTAVIPATDITSAGVPLVTVFNPAPGGGTSNGLPFFITQTGAAITGYDLDMGEDPQATFVGVTADGIGNGILVVAQYATNPTPMFLLAPDGHGYFYDVHITPPGAFTHVTIQFCGAGAGMGAILFWNGSMWVPASSQSFGAGGCVTVVVDDTTVPSLTDLAGAVFGVGGVGPPSAFADVPPSHWAWSWIKRLAQAGITNGCATLLYCPENNVTRAEMAKFLLKGMHGRNYMPPAATSVFSDVPTTYWAADWIGQLYQEGITNGCATDPLRYCPDSNVTRAEMAKFLLRAKYGSMYTPPAVGTSTGFTDVPTSFWAAAWIKQLAAEGITSGCGGSNYCPNLPVTRAEMAKFLVLTFNLP
jgi:hypothetical protein